MRLDNNQKLKKITIDHKDWLYSIGFTTQDFSGLLFSSHHGGYGGSSGGQLSEVTNLYVSEFIFRLIWNVKNIAENEFRLIWILECLKYFIDHNYLIRFIKTSLKGLDAKFEICR